MEGPRRARVGQTCSYERALILPRRVQHSWPYHLLILLQWQLSFSGIFGGDIQATATCEDTGRDWDDAAANEGTPGAMRIWMR